MTPMPSDRTPEPLSREERERILARCEAAKNPDDKLCGERPFPIQQSEPVPWGYAERAYRTYSARFGTQQSLERLAERGGFGLEEFSCLYLGHVPGECRPPHHPPRNKASLHCVRFASEALAQHVIARLARIDLPRALATIAALEQQLAETAQRLAELEDGAPSRDVLLMQAQIHTRCITAEMRAEAAERQLSEARGLLAEIAARPCSRYTIMSPPTCDLRPSEVEWCDPCRIRAWLTRTAEPGGKETP